MYGNIIKKIIDVIGAFILLVFCAIPFFIIAIRIKKDSKGTIFYRQYRIGKDGKLFRIFKFRTMVANADQIGSFSTSVNDKRITPFGAFLRKTSLDELPQIINILMGQMSFIGPRPDVPQQKKLYTEKEFQNRHKVLPGITGLAQCFNRHESTEQQRKKSDIFYVNNVSLWLDIKIAFMTIKTLLKGSY